MIACEPYLLGKITKSPFNGKGEEADKALSLIHSDVCGPFREMARGGFFYFITFIDDLSRYGNLFLLKNKSESFEKFKEFKPKWRTKPGRVLKLFDHIEEVNT